jgi:hypothetical protein
MSELTLQPCSPEFCNQSRRMLDQFCQQMGFPPGHPIVMQMPNGDICYCTCRGAGSDKSADAADTE